MLVVVETNGLKALKGLVILKSCLSLSFIMFIKINLCLSVPIACLNHSHDCDVKVSKGVCCGLCFRGWFARRGRGGDGFG